jgi:hypothetical protein
MAFVPGDSTTVGGNITSITGMSAGTWKYTRITPFGDTIASLDDTHLGSADYEERVPGALKVAKQLEITVQWDYEADFPDVGTVGTIDITLPVRQGTVTPGDYAGSGFLVDVAAPEHVAANERALGTIIWEFDGKTSPVYTKHA